MRHIMILAPALLLYLAPSIGTSEVKISPECAYDAQFSYIVGVLVGVVMTEKPPDICLPSIRSDVISAVGAAVELEARGGGNPVILDGPVLNSALKQAGLKKPE